MEKFFSRCQELICTLFMLSCTLFMLFLLKGIPAEEILNYAEKNGIDLIVMGTKGLKGIEKLLLVSVAENVIRHSKVPILTVR